MRKLLHKESDLSLLECTGPQMRKMIISAKKLHKDHRPLDLSQHPCDTLNDRGMRAALRYLRNLGQYRRHGVLISPVKRANPSSFLENALSINLDDNSSPQSPLASPFGLSDERINTITLLHTHGRDLSLLELWRTDSPIDLNEDEQSYLDFTKEYRSFDEHKLQRLRLQRRESCSAAPADPAKPKHKSFTISLKEMQNESSQAAPLDEATPAFDKPISHPPKGVQT